MALQKTQEEEFITSNWRFPKLMLPKFSLSFEITSLLKPFVILSMGVPVFFLEQIYCNSKNSALLMMLI